MLGGITGVSPTEVVILGAGTAGEYAARAALGLGATVKIFDNSIKKLMDIQNILASAYSLPFTISRYSIKSLKQPMW